MTEKMQTRLEKIIERERNKNAVSAKMIDMLYEISDDIDFVCGTLVNVKEDRNRQAIIDYIDAGIDVNEEQIILLSVWLSYREDDED